MRFEKKQPCNNCPYRKDAPLRYWSILEFAQLLKSEREQLGTVYGCHKKDDHVCVGWLMNQDERGFPSIALRVALMKHKVSREYLDSLSCPSEMFRTVGAMCKANYSSLIV